MFPMKGVLRLWPTSLGPQVINVRTRLFPRSVKHIAASWHSKASALSKNVVRKNSMTRSLVASYTDAVRHWSHRARRIVDMRPSHPIKSCTRPWSQTRVSHNGRVTPLHEISRRSVHGRGRSACRRSTWWSLWWLAWSMVVHGRHRERRLTRVVDPRRWHRLVSVRTIGIPSWGHPRPREMYAGRMWDSLSRVVSGPSFRNRPSSAIILSFTSKSAEDENLPSNLRKGENVVGEEDTFAGTREVVSFNGTQYVNFLHGRVVGRPQVEHCRGTDVFKVHRDKPSYAAPHRESRGVQRGQTEQAGGRCCFGWWRRTSRTKWSWRRHERYNQTGDCTEHWTVWWNHCRKSNEERRRCRTSMLSGWLLEWVVSASSRMWTWACALWSMGTDPGGAVFRHS